MRAHFRVTLNRGDTLQSNLPNDPGSSLVCMNTVPMNTVPMNTVPMNTVPKVIPVTTSVPAPITLDQFLKITGLVGTGGQAKIAIQEGYVMVNGELETRRRRKLAIGDVVVVDNEHKFVVTEEMIRRA